MPRRLTELAQAAVSEVVRAGDVAVDATAGNGYDTAFLADAVGPDGRVFAIDTQQAAIRATRRRLGARGTADRVTLVEDCHSRLALTLPATLELNAAMFNLGYLPGSDKAVVTQPASTLAALETCCDRLAERGVITVLAYRGHSGGGRRGRETHQKQQGPRRGPGHLQDPDHQPGPCHRNPEGGQRRPQEQSQPAELLLRESLGGSLVGAWGK